jgi:hypothetical protein
VLPWQPKAAAAEVVSHDDCTFDQREFATKSRGGFMNFMAI